MSVFLYSLVVLCFVLKAHSECTDCLSFTVSDVAGELKVERHALMGYDLYAVLVSNYRECFLNCSQAECRCMSFNFKRNPEDDGRHKCELKYERKSSNISALVWRPEFNYHDIRTTKPVITHCGTSSPCLNRCCDTGPCENEGKCEDICEDIRRVNCTCPPGYTGRFCQVKINASSCVDFSQGGARPQSGLFPVQFPDGEKEIFCHFDYSDNTAWALLTSFSFGNNLLFADKSFGKDFPVNLSNFNFQAYRLSLGQTSFLRKRSKFVASSCNYHQNQEIIKSLDYLRFNTSVLNIEELKASCVKVEFVNIRGFECKHCIVWLNQRQSFMLNISDRNSGAYCNFQVSQISSHQRSFGSYSGYHPDFSCVTSENSTTQWWLGGPIP